MSDDGGREHGGGAPAAAWAGLVAGNARFAADEAVHPRQDAERRRELAGGQRPSAAVLGCSDSRAAVETVLDQGLGDVFVVRNAGQLPSPDAIASLEYAVAALGVALVVVLAHESCGAVGAAIAAEGEDAPPLPPRIARMIGPIRDTVRSLPAGARGADAVLEAHLRATAEAVLRESELLSEAIAEGRLGLVGAVYRLGDGRIVPRLAIGAGLDPLP